MQLGSISEGILQDRCKCVDIAAGKDKLRSNRRDKIACRADVIACNNGTTAAHGFVDDNREGFVIRGKNHEIGGGVDHRELRLIDEAKKANARRNAKSGCLGFELRTERALTGEDKEPVGKLCVRKGAKEIERALPGLKFRAEEDNSLIR